MTRRDTVRLSDEELAEAVDDLAEDLGSRSEVYREAVRAYVGEDMRAPAGMDPSLPAKLREAYATLTEHCDAGDRMQLGEAKSVVAERAQIPKSVIMDAVIKPLEREGYVGIKNSLYGVSLVVLDENATLEEMEAERWQPPAPKDARDTDDVDAEFDRLDSATIDRGDGVETDGGRTLPNDYEAEDGYDSDSGVDRCPHCETALVPQTGKHAPVYDQRGRKFDTTLDTDPNQRPFFCEDCWADLEANQKQTRNQSLGRFVTDGGADEIVAVSPATGNVYAVTEYRDVNDNGHIIAERKRLLTRYEVEPELIHAAARRALRGGGRDD